MSRAAGVSATAQSSAKGGDEHTVPVAKALASPAHGLDAEARGVMESRFDHDFSQVRVHTDQAAAESARALHARAYAVDDDLVFAPGQYRPHTAQGRELLAHELAHVVQRGQSGPTEHAEQRAQDAASAVARGHSVSAQGLGAAAPGVHRDPDDAQPAVEPPPKFELKPITLPWGVFAAHFPSLHLTPPSALQPAAPGVGSSPTLRPLPQLVPGAPSGGGPLAPTAQPLQTPAAPAATAGPSSAPDLPSRIGFTDIGGKLSLGGRFSFPVAPQPLPGTPPERRPQPPGVTGAGPSALSVSDYQFELLDMSLTGKVPRGFDAVDKGDLIKAGFGILSTYIVPDLMRSLANSVGGKPGAQYQLDFTIGGDFKSAGVTLTMPFLDAKPAKRPKPSSP